MGDDTMSDGGFIWAKTDMDNPSSGLWLSLRQHLVDTESISHHIWNDYLPRRTRNMLDSALSGHGEIVLAFLSGVHDVGKATPAFEMQGSFRPDLMRMLSDYGLTIPPSVSKSSRLRHETSGFVALDSWLKGHGMADGTADSIAIVVGGHHGIYHVRTRYDIESNDLGDYYGDAGWESIRTSIIEWMSTRTGFDGIMDSLGDESIPLVIQSLLTACVVMSDWMASSTLLFPLMASGNVDDADEPVRVHRAWSMLHLQRPWDVTRPDSTVDTMLTAEFGLQAGSVPNPMQRLVVDMASRVHEPTMMIIESPMGSGKTEAALMAAHHIAYNTGAGGVAFALPTQATADGILPRMARWVPKVTDGRESIELVHGNARLNADFADIRTNGVYDDDNAGHGAQVSWWFDGARRGMLASFVVCTIDQILLSALQAKHFDLRHLGLANKVVIIDEVHAADDYMAEYLKRALSWLAAMGSSVILMSATLPEGRRSDLVRAYSEALHHRIDRKPPAERVPDGYPLITSVDSSGTVFRTCADSMGREVSIGLDHADDDTGMISMLSDALTDGGSACVIRDTVKSAQSTYRGFLAAGFSPDELMLVHARFTSHNRALFTGRLERMFGRDGAERPRPPRRFVVIGTQVLEQSLDIDFDIMVSDVAPMDLILQRAGRLHRHERPRPCGLERPRLIITGWRDGAGDDGIPDVDRGIGFVYGFGINQNRSKILRSISMLRDMDSISLPGDVRRLVDAAYREGEWHGEFSVAIAEEDVKRLRITTGKAAMAESSVLRFPYNLFNPPEPYLGRNGYALWGSNSAGERSSSDAKLTAKVRDSMSSLRVILMRRMPDGVTFADDDLADAYGFIDMTAPPDGNLERDIMSQMVGLPASLSNPKIIDATIKALESDMPGAWKDSRMLSGELVLFLDESGNADIKVSGNRHFVHYDDIMGMSEKRRD